MNCVVQLVGQPWHKRKVVGLNPMQGSTYFFEQRADLVELSCDCCFVYQQPLWFVCNVHVGGLAVAETRPAHWVIVLHLGLEGCSQPRELWFVDILMYVYGCASY